MYLCHFERGVTRKIPTSVELKVKDGEDKMLK